MGGRNVLATNSGAWTGVKIDGQWHTTRQNDSIHGDNLVVPVNFMAIAYDLCEPAERVRNILDQYERDGLAFQRYLRQTQTGAGNDIFANNGSTIVGLYRNVCGVQPKWNRLYLEPHLTPELDGTLLKYWLRDQSYEIALKVNDHRIAVDGFALRASSPFALAVDRDTARYRVPIGSRWNR